MRSRALGCRAWTSPRSSPSPSSSRSPGRRWTRPPSTTSRAVPGTSSRLADNEAAWRRAAPARASSSTWRGVDPSHDHPRRADRDAGRHRADGRPRARPPGRRARDGPRGRGGRGAVHVVDDVVALDRGGRGGGPDRHDWFQLYTQADPGRSRELVERAAAAGYRRADRDRGPAASWAIASATGDPASTCRPRQLRRRARWADPRRRRPRDRGRLRSPGGAARRRADLGRPRRDPVVVAAAARAQGDPDRRGRPARGRARRRRHRREQPRRPPARPGAGHDRRPDRGRRCRRGATELWSTAASGAASTSRSPSPSAPAACSSAGRCSGRSRPAGQAGVERALAILREEFEIALALLGAPTPADLTPAHVAPSDPEPEPERHRPAADATGPGMAG